MLGQFNRDLPRPRPRAFHRPLSCSRRSQDLPQLFLGKTSSPQKMHAAVGHRHMNARAFVMDEEELFAVFMSWLRPPSRATSFRATVSVSSDQISAVPTRGCPSGQSTTMIVVETAVGKADPPVSAACRPPRPHPVLRRRHSLSRSGAVVLGSLGQTYSGEANRRELLVFRAVPGLGEVVSPVKRIVLQFGQYQHPPTMHRLAIFVDDVRRRETAVLRTVVSQAPSQSRIVAGGMPRGETPRRQTGFRASDMRPATAGRRHPGKTRPRHKGSARERKSPAQRPARKPRLPTPRTLPSTTPAPRTTTAASAS